MAVDSSANPAYRFNELPDETQEFLSQLREDDIETLKDGLRGHCDAHGRQAYEVDDSCCCWHVYRYGYVVRKHPQSTQLD